MRPFRKSPLVLGLKFGYVTLHQFNAFFELLFFYLSFITSIPDKTTRSDNLTFSYHGISQVSSESGSTSFCLKCTTPFFLYTLSESATHPRERSFSRRGR